ncbi:MAG: sulfatase-like hydrolase/transferase [Bacteroidales bacterium]
MLKLKISVLLLAALTSCKQEKEEKMNLLFIMTDQQRYDALSLAGNTVLETPNLDRLARQGAWFRNAYTPCAVCGPARASILTGHTVEKTGVNTNNKSYAYDEEVVMAMPTFDEILTENGYHSEYYGKWHVLSSHAQVYKNPKLESENGRSVFGPGGQSHVYMDYLDKHVPVRPLKPGELYDTFTKRPYETDPMDKFHGMNPEEFEELNPRRVQPDLHGRLMIPAEHSLTAFQAKETIDALERLKDSVFSITCSFHFPHAPILPTDPYYNMYPADDMIPPVSIGDDMENSPYKTANGRPGMPEYSDPQKIRYMISNYYGMVKEIDDWVGKILDKLDELELTDNTLVIFMSDHGEMLGAHGMREKNVFYEESSHVPLMIRFPGKIESDLTIDGYVSLIDLFPTILDYLRVEPRESDGKSLRGLIEGTDREHGEYVVTEWNYRGDVAPNYMVVKDGWKLMIPYSVESTVINALYDLHTDPHEMNNLLGNNPDRDKYEQKVEELRECLLEWLEKNDSEHYDGVNNRKLI